MAEIRHLENRHDVIFFCRGWSDLDKLLETGAEWRVDSDDVVEIETRCRIPIWRTFGWINGISFQSHLPHCKCCHLANSMSWFQSYVSYCRVLPLGEFNGMSSRSTYHIAGCCHLMNSLSRFQSRMPHCRMQSPGEISVMITPHCRV